MENSRSGGRSLGKITRALISVSHKEGIIDFAKGLSKLSIEILSTGGTAKLLRDAGVAVKDVSEFTGFPEMLDGRVKTLHPKVHGGLLGRRNNPEHVKQMQQHGIQPIDLVVVNLYPFEQTVAKPGCTLEDAIENIDIGGPTMLRSAAKNYTDVAVVVSPRDYARVLEEIQRTGEVSARTRFELCRTVFLHTARYDSAISAWLDNQVPEDQKTRFPNILTLQFEKVQNLRYGENPHQQGAFYREFGRKEPSVANARQLQGKEMSFNNFLDANSALELVKEYEGIACRHREAQQSLRRGDRIRAWPKPTARRATCDPVSAFGGVIAFNHLVDLETAQGADLHLRGGRRRARVRARRAGRTEKEEGPARARCRADAHGPSRRHGPEEGRGRPDLPGPRPGQDRRCQEAAGGDEAETYRATSTRPLPLPGRSVST